MTHLSAVLLSLVVVASTAPAASAQQRRVTRRAATTDYASHVDTTFAFDKTGSITVNATSGDIVVTGWDRAQIHVRAVSDDDAIRFDASAGRMTLEVGGQHRGSDSRFELSVPYGVRVYASSRSGDVSVRGTRGQVEVHTQSGDMLVDEVVGRLDVNTVSGDLRANQISGDAEINSISGDARLADVRGDVDATTVSGDVDLRGVSAKLVRARTTNGDVTYDGIIDPAGRYELSTHSGDVHLHVPRDVSAQLTVSTWSGGINSDFPITLKPGEHGIGLTSSKRFSFQLGAGAARITAETFSGDITISSDGRGAPPTERR